MSFHIFRRSTEDAVVGTQFLRNQPVVTELTDTYGGIKTLADEVSESLAVIGDDGDLRVLLKKLGQHWTDPETSHCSGKGETQDASSFNGT